MKQFFTFLGIVAMGATAYGQADTDIVNIPDVNFKRALLNEHNIDTNKDREISYGEARAYTGNINVSNKNISSLVGIEAFVNITELSCSNNQLTSLDISKNTALERLDCSNNQLTSLDVSKNTALHTLSCSNNQLTSLDISKNTALGSLYCYDNQLTSLDVSKNTALLILDCSNNQLTSLDVSKNTVLWFLTCSDNQLTSLDISKNTALYQLSCYTNLLTNLDVSGATALTDLYCSNNLLTNLDVSKNTALKELSCSNNLLTNLDVSKNTALTELSCSSNLLTNLDVSKNTALTDLNCSSNLQLTSLDVSKNTALRSLRCHDNQLTQLNLANGNNEWLRLRAENNPNLMCIQIDRGYTPSYRWWQKDTRASYSDNCNYPTLSTTEVKAENAIQILNPVKDNLIIKTTAKIESIEIYNTAGQLVKVLFRGNTQVQDLAKGVYLIKITTDKGVITQKIIKQ